MGTAVFSRPLEETASQLGVLLHQIHAIAAGFSQAGPSLGHSVSSVEHRNGFLLNGLVVEIG